MELKINGKNYACVYVPLKDSSGDIVGMAFAGEPSADIEGYIRSRIVKFAVFTVILLVVAIVVGALISKKIGKNIAQTEEAIFSLSEGNLNVVMAEEVLKRPDEIGDMGRAVNALVEKLRDIIGKINDTVEDLKKDGESLDSLATNSSNAADDISLAVEDISKGAVSQAEEIESASHDIISMGDMIGGIVDNVSALTHTSESMGTAGEESVKTITGLSESNDRTTAAISQISKQINMTDESVKKIGEAANLITSIASQTSLLSLNASIESARAGEAGKGFAVVATEIQKLAAESSDAAVEIQRIIDEIASESAKAVSEMQTAETLIGEQQEKLDETRTKFGEVNDGIKTSREGTEKIRLSADQCNEARTSVVDVISNLSAISQENAASAEETTASMEELNVTINLLAEEAGKLKDTSVKLKENMTFFKL